MCPQESGVGAPPRIQTLPSDEIRQILWRYAERFDLQMVVQSARSVARGQVARLVADGARHSHDWDDQKAQLLPAFDAAGISSLSLEPEHGGYIVGPKNLAMGLAAFELAWVDGGAATGALASHLALAPIQQRGTAEQKRSYMTRCAPGTPEAGDSPGRGAFCLTEPIPFVGVDTGVLAGRVSVVRWEEGEEPILLVEKRGRFITNMGFATFVTAAVDSGDERIKGSCMIILEEGDKGVYDRGTPTKKLVHQLSSTNDPIFRLEVPASRIIGGYEVKDGVLVPKFGHGEIIEAVFRRTRVPVGLMSAAKLLSAVEPVIRYQRGRFRGGEGYGPGSPRWDLGLQQKEDVLHRLIDVWGTGEAAAALGFSAARHFDEFDPLEERAEDWFAEQGISGPRARLRIFRQRREEALELVRLRAKPEGERDEARVAELTQDPMAEFMIADAVANVLCPAAKLWNTGHGATMMREAVSLMGGYGITEDCPGFLGQKWMDVQLEATYEGPESVQRRQLSVTMADPIFLAQLERWIIGMREVADSRAGTGACTIASALSLWLWTLRHLQKAKDANGKVLFRGPRQGVTFPMADALCWLLASRAQILDLIELEEVGAERPELAESLPGTVAFLTDLCHVQAGRAAGEAGRICAELVFGYNRHPSWDGDSCFQADALNELEGLIPGIAAGARAFGDVLERDGSHAHKAGPCACTHGMETFNHLRTKLDGCLTGCRLAKDRAARALSEVMIPEALDYPL